MKAPELTDELKNDLKALKMRASMDPKRFYKKNDRDGFPKYFQVYRQSTGYVVGTAQQSKRDLTYAQQAGGQSLLRLYHDANAAQPATIL